MVNTQVSPLNTTLIEEQAKLEAEMKGLGIEAFRKIVAKAKEHRHEAETPYGLALVGHCMTGMTDAILSFVAEAKSGKPGRRHSAVRYLEQINADVVAMLTLRVVIDTITVRSGLAHSALYLGSRLEDEVRFRQFSDEAKPLFRCIAESVKSATSYRHKRRVAVHAMGRAGIEWNGWPDDDKLHLGVKLIEIMRDVTGLIEIEDKIVGWNKTQKVVTATPKVTEWINQKNSRCEMLSPIFMPCVIPPRDWTSTRSGGYWTDAIHQPTLVKTNNSAYLDELDMRVDEMPAVYETVNAMQRTAWKINAPVLEVIRAMLDNKLALAGIPDLEDHQYLACPKCGEPVLLSQRDTRKADRKPHACFETDEEALKTWKRKASKLHEFNTKLRSKRLQVAKIVWVAEKYVGYSQMYFPHNLDFRGRVYAIPNYLTPQGDDLSKGLLTFGEAKEIGDGTGAGWLAIHGANCFGFDKATLEERIEWVEKNEERILSVAADPMGDLWWTEADSPFCFLAFCFEWAGFQAEGFSFKSSLPIAMDATCSGIQHFSGMLRDAVGGQAVNLTNNAKRADIYAEVCKVFTEKLCLNVATSDYAQVWLDMNPDRSTVKRQVMTLPYGATPFSCREYTQQWAVEKKGADLPWPEDKMFEATQFASALIWESISEVVIKAREAMDWLQVYAKHVAAEGLPVTWTTPVGLPIQQVYMDFNVRRIKTKLGDSVVYLNLRQGSDKIDRRKMQSSIAPNFVHSMDAAHLMWSVGYAVENGVTSFAMIHDSFGTHASDAAMFGACLREAFVDMYQGHDVLGEFKTSMIEMLPDEKIAELPTDLQPGSLDLEEVKLSEFFFA